MKDFFDAQEWDNEILTFLTLCSPEDAAFMSTPAGERRVEDYVRLMTLALVFGFRRVSMRVLQEAEEKGADIFPALERAEKDFPLVSGWVDAFIANVQDGELRGLLRGEWEKKLALADQENFHLNQLF